MKKLFELFLLLVCIVVMVKTASSRLERPDTNLEFWICDNVTDYDFSNYQKRPFLMGGDEYYGTGYALQTTEGGAKVDPEYCVIYTVSSYPDYSSLSKHITGIKITDPSVEIYGLTVNSSFDDIDLAMENNGFNMISQKDDKSERKYEKGKVFIRFWNKRIDIWVEVTNRRDIVF